MGDKGEGAIKNFRKWVTSFMDGPMYLIPCCIIHSCCFVFCSNYVYSTGQYNLDFVVTHDFGTKIWKAKYDHTFLKNCPIVSALDNFFPHFRLLVAYCTCRNLGSFCLKWPIYIYTIFFLMFQGLVTQQIKIFIQTWFFVQFDPFCTSRGECKKRRSAYFGVFFGQFGDCDWPTRKKAAASLCNSVYSICRKTRHAFLIFCVLNTWLRSCENYGFLNILRAESSVS